jgi:spore coat protein U-like protein
MTKTILATIFAATALSLTSSAAFAQTAAANMDVSMTVAAECTVATDPVAFGNRTLIGAAVPITGNMTVQCTANAPYQIQLSVGSGTGAAVETRFMTGAASGDLATYTVHQGAATGPVWGVTLGTDTLDGVATGAAEVFPFTAVLAANQSVEADVYADVLVATINY